MIGTSSGKTIMATNKVLGRSTAGTGAIEEISIGSNLTLSGGTLSASGGVTGVAASATDILSVSGSDIAADDPGADRLVFWDDSDNKLTYLTAGSGLTITGTTITAAGGVTNVTATAPLTSSGGATPDISTSIATNRIVGRSSAGTGVMEQLTPVGITVSGGNITGIGGTVGTVDNAVPRADGTGGYTVQGSGLIVEDAIESFTSITGDAGTDVITATGSAFANGQPVRFTALTGGSGLNTTTNYFVREVSGATFKVETSIGGGAINFTTNITAGTLLTGHSVQVNVTLSENTTETNSSLVLTPKGTGALIAGPKPDGTATGGNARGTNAVDLQVVRAANTQVASGLRAVVIGGTSNTASGEDSIAIGNGSVATGRRAFAGGNAGTTVTGFQAFGFGQQVSVTASESVGMGKENVVSAGSAAITGGYRNSVSQTEAGILCGSYGLANRYGMQAHANGQFSATGITGDAQRARFVLRCKTTTNAAVEMALDGSTAYLTIPSGKVMFMNIKVVGSKSDGSAVATYERQYAVKNVAGTSSEVYAPITIGTDNAAGTTIEVATVDAGDYVRIRPTGIASETWRWVASVDAVEVAYGT